MNGLRQLGLVLLLGCLFAPQASAQRPDVALRVDANLSLTAGVNGSGRIRWYDPLGRYSTAGLGLTLDNGLYVLVTQRLQRVPGGADPDTLDQAYVEEPGIWRAGRQVLPIGGGFLFREYALAARVDLPGDRVAIPITLAVCANGDRRQRGIIGRIGREIGLTVVAGRNFGINPSSLATLRDLEAAPGADGGWRWIIAGDISRQFGPLIVQGEFALLRQPEGSTKTAGEVSDLRASLNSFEGQVVTTLGWSRDWRTQHDAYRFETETLVSRSVTIRSFVRIDGGAWRDITMGVRIRL